MSAAARLINGPEECFTTAQAAVVNRLIALGLFAPSRKALHGDSGCWVRVFEGGDIEVISGSVHARRPAELLAALLADAPAAGVSKLLMARGIPYELRSIR